MTWLTSEDKLVRSRFFGYRRRDVDAYVDRVTRLVDEQHLVVEETRDELTQLRAHRCPQDELGRHLGRLLTRFAEGVAASEQEATDQAAAIIVESERRAAEIEAEARKLLADARALAEATFEEAGRRYEMMTAARATATTRIEDAIECMADMLASLAAIPELSALPPSTHASDADSLLHLSNGAVDEEREVWAAQAT